MRNTTTDHRALPKVALWTSTFDRVPMSQAQDALAELETAGYRMLWIPEGTGREPFVSAALLLSATQEMTLATGIASIYARDAFTTSAAAKTLAERFPNRILVGLGVSHSHLVAGLRGHEYLPPLQAMQAYLDTIDSATTFDALAPEGPIPYVLAALGPRMTKLAGDRTLGAHSYLATVEHTSKARSVLGSKPLLIPEQTVVLDADPSSARDIARGFLGDYLSRPNYRKNFLSMGFSEDDLVDGGSNRLVDSLVAHGDEDSIHRRILEHLDAGADQVAVQIIISDDTRLPLQEWRVLGPALDDLL
jgi:probable F420-dependent oxidoreductase